MPLQLPPRAMASSTAGTAPRRTHAAHMHTRADTGRVNAMLCRTDTAAANQQWGPSKTALVLLPRFVNHRKRRASRVSGKGPASADLVCCFFIGNRWGGQRGGKAGGADLSRRPPWCPLSEWEVPRIPTPHRWSRRLQGADLPHARRSACPHAVRNCESDGPSARDGSSATESHGRTGRAPLINLP